MVATRMGHAGKRVTRAPGVPAGGPFAGHREAARLLLAGLFCGGAAGVTGCSSIVDVEGYEFIGDSNGSNDMRSPRADATCDKAAVAYCTCAQEVGVACGPEIEEVFYLGCTGGLESADIARCYGDFYDEGEIDCGAAADACFDDEDASADPGSGGSGELTQCQRGTAAFCGCYVGESCDVVAMSLACSAPDSDAAVVYECLGGRLSGTQIDCDAARDACIVCEDSCTFAGDGACDDGGERSEYNVCAYGTDCADCGSRPATGAR